MSRDSSNASMRPVVTIQDAERIAESKGPIPLDDAVRRLRDRKLLRKDLGIDPVRFSRQSLVNAVSRGLAEQNSIRSQDIGLAEWKNLRDEARAAVKALDKLIKRKRFTLAQLIELEFKHDVEPDSKKSIATLKNIGQGAHQRATHLKDAIVSARDAAQIIADRARSMARGVAKRKVKPGEPFRRGFVIEMMKTWLKLTGSKPSSKRSEGNPFASFADAALQSIDPNPDLPSCAGVIRSARKIFLELLEEGAFDDTREDLRQGDIPPPK